MILVLSLILFLLLIIIGKLRGLKTFLCLYINYFLIIMYIVFMGFGFNAIVLAFLTCIASSFVSLFILNGINIKTISSFISVICVLMIISIIIYLICSNANIQGFTYEDLDRIGPYSFDINYNMTKVIIGMFLVSTIGTINDTSISISTAMKEVYENNKHLATKELFKSGMNVGKDILSTTINTLYFAFLGGFIGFFFLHYNSSIDYIINNKVFIQDVFLLLFCFISSILIIPLTAFICSKFVNFNKNQV